MSETKEQTYPIGGGDGHSSQAHQWDPTEKYFKHIFTVEGGLAGGRASFGRVSGPAREKSSKTF